MSYPPLAGATENLISCKSHKILPLNVCWFPLLGWVGLLGTEALLLFRITFPRLVAPRM
jgi:hypothetical protein